MKNSIFAKFYESNSTLKAKNLAFLDEVNSVAILEKNHSVVFKVFIQG